MVSILSLKETYAIYNCQLRIPQQVDSSNFLIK